MGLQKVREEMVARDWAQRQLAVRSGIHESVISAILTGKRGLSVNNAKKLAKVLNVNWYDLFD